MRKSPFKISPEPEEDLSDAVWYEQPLVLDDDDFDEFLHSERRQGGPFWCCPVKVPDGFGRRGFVTIERRSREPLIMRGTEYLLFGFVDNIVRTQRRPVYSVTLRDPVLPLAHPDPNFHVRY